MADHNAADTPRSQALPSPGVDLSGNQAMSPREPHKLDNAIDELQILHAACISNHEAAILHKMYPEAERLREVGENLDKARRVLVTIREIAWDLA